MAYSKTIWKDRNVQYPNRFTYTDNGDGTITLIPSQGSITEQGTPVNATNMNNIEDGIITVNDATFFKQVGGTANAITTVINVDLTDGFPINIIVKYPNKGVATTLNGIPILRPISLTTPVLFANQLVTLVYNESNLCFFYKAIAEGNADATMVLEGETFSNFNQTGLTGTMKNNGIMTKHISSPGSYLDLIKGFYAAGSKITGTTVSETFPNATVNNSNQIQPGYSGYGVNGILYNGSYNPINVITGRKECDVQILYDNQGEPFNYLFLNIPNVPSYPKIIFIYYDGYGIYTTIPNYPDKSRSFMTSCFYDPNNYFNNLFNSISWEHSSFMISPDSSRTLGRNDIYSSNIQCTYTNNTLSISGFYMDAVPGLNFGYILFL